MKQSKRNAVKLDYYKQLGTGKFFCNYTLLLWKTPLSRNKFLKIHNFVITEKNLQKK